MPMITPPAHSLPRTVDPSMPSHHGTIGAHVHNPMLQDSSSSLSPLHPPAHRQHHQHHHHTNHPPVALPPLSDPHVSVSVPVPVSVYQPIDPQIISQPPGTSDPHAHAHANLHPNHHPHHHYTSFDDHPSSHHHHHHHHAHDSDPDTFQALLNASDEDMVGVGVGVGTVGVVNSAGTSTNHHGLHHPSHDHHRPRTQEEDDAEQAAVDRDMEMLIEQPQDEDDEQGQPQSQGPGQASNQQQHQLRDIQIPGSVAMMIDSSGPTSDINLLLAGGLAGGSASNGVGVGSTSRPGGGSGSKMDVSHLLSAHSDDDDKHDGIPKGRTIYDMKYDGTGA
ncbi:hypothetical protein QBC34DRAFT_411450 [Podospora aff. communis PSN243]|uniref:Uncharacterized protein n=1 Tax=Podospora aff. communis PSN243 TaxID=3040156 RepID=A0AAV9GGU6_9PEZI|nr:hypothetical protein QBC34DRAFT_411450 [Podospora aff. communis PSN243]